MSRILSAALLGHKNAWVLGVGVAVSLAIGCGSKGDNSDDDGYMGTGGGYRPPTQGGSGPGTVIYLTGQGGARPTGGRNPGQGGFFGQGGFVPTGGRNTNTTPSTCLTGTLNCPCYTSGACGNNLTCNANKICVSSGTPGTGGAVGTGGSKATTGGSTTAGTAGGSTAVGVGGTTAATVGGTTSATVGGTTSAAVGGAGTGGAPITTGGTSPFVTTGGAATDGGLPEAGGTPATGGASSTVIQKCAVDVVNTPNGVVPCTTECQITGTLGNDATLSYECDCADNRYVCFAGSNSTVACPASIALEQETACNRTTDDFCTLTSTKTTVSGGTTIVATTTYSCVCSASDKIWTCTK